MDPGLCCGIIILSIESRRDLLLIWLQGLQHLFYSAHQVASGQVGGDISQGAADVGLDQFDHLGNRRGEALDAQVDDPLDQIGEDALVDRVQVLDQDEGHAAVGGHVFEELLEGLQAACRGADADDGKDVGLLGFPVGLGVLLFLGGFGGLLKRLFRFRRFLFGDPLFRRGAFFGYYFVFSRLPDIGRWFA